MPIFKSTVDLLSNPWTNAEETVELPLKEEWLSTIAPTFDNINTWEQIYFQAGNIGVYAAWSPYVELYVIVYNLLNKIEVFDSSENTVKRLNEFDIDLHTNTVWV